MAYRNSNLKKPGSSLPLSLMAALSVGMTGCQDLPTDVTEAQVQHSVGNASGAAFGKGGTTQLTLRYEGTLIDAQVTVEQTNQGNSFATAAPKAKTIIFDGVVQPGGGFTVVGADRDDTLGPVVRIRVNGKMNAKFRTNCSVILHPGMSDRDFAVVSAVQACDD